MERIVERMLFASRWLLAPLYLGLAALLAVIVVHFFKELLHVVIHTLSLGETDLVLVALEFVDLTLVASLIVMVMLSGYEKLDAGSLKIKVAASIVAISSIHLLKAFMNATEMANDKLLLLVVVHLTFVVSALMLTWMDRLVAKH